SARQRTRSAAKSRRPSISSESASRSSHLTDAGTTTGLIGAAYPPAGYAYDEHASRPHTTRPNGPLLVATWRPPLVHVPIGVPRARSAFAISYVPSAPTGCHP